MNKKKIIFIAISLVVVAVLVVSAISIVNAVNNNKQKNALVDELNEINELTSSMNMDEIKAKLDSRVTSGEYLPVEDALKEYLSDVMNVVDEMVQISQEEELTEILSADNYASDGPDFVATKEYIATKVAQLETIKSRVEELTTNEKIMTYIEAKNVKNKYKKVYEELATSDTSETENEASEAIDDLISMLNKSNEILDFLKENQNDWKIQGKNIVFSTDELVTKYNQYLNELN